MFNFKKSSDLDQAIDALNKADNTVAKVLKKLEEAQAKENVEREELESLQFTRKKVIRKSIEDASFTDEIVALDKKISITRARLPILREIITEIENTLVVERKKIIPFEREAVDIHANMCDAAEKEEVDKLKGLLRLHFSRILFIKQLRNFPMNIDYFVNELKGQFYTEKLDEIVVSGLVKVPKSKHLRSEDVEAVKKIERDKRRKIDINKREKDERAATLKRSEEFNSVHKVKVQARKEAETRSRNAIKVRSGVRCVKVRFHHISIYRGV